MIKKAVIYFIKLYQDFVSPNLGINCRFHPSCSEYCRQTIEKYGLIKGVWLGTRRIIKCNPWFQGGVDLP